MTSMTRTNVGLVAVTLVVLSLFALTESGHSLDDRSDLEKTYERLCGAANKARATFEYLKDKAAKESDSSRKSLISAAASRYENEYLLEQGRAIKFASENKLCKCIFEDDHYKKQGETRAEKIFNELLTTQMGAIQRGTEGTSIISFMLRRR